MSLSVEIYMIDAQDFICQEVRTLGVFSSVCRLLEPARRGGRSRESATHDSAELCGHPRTGSGLSSSPATLLRLPTALIDSLLTCKGPETIAENSSPQYHTDR